MKTIMINEKNMTMNLKKDKKYKIKNDDIYKKDDNISSFYWSCSNCEFKTAITEFNLLYLYIPEII